jgi:hypothetical protein
VSDPVGQENMLVISDSYDCIAAGPASAANELPQRTAERLVEDLRTS